MGMNSLKLLDEILASASEYGFEFVSASEYTKMYKNKKTTYTTQINAD